MGGRRGDRVGKLGLKMGRGMGNRDLWWETGEGGTGGRVVGKASWWPEAGAGRSKRGPGSPRGRGLRKPSPKTLSRSAGAGSGQAGQLAGGGAVGGSVAEAGTAHSGRRGRGRGRNLHFPEVTASTSQTAWPRLEQQGGVALGWRQGEWSLFGDFRRWVLLLGFLWEAPAGRASPYREDCSLGFLVAL